MRRRRRGKNVRDTFIWKKKYFHVRELKNERRKNKNFMKNFHMPSRIDGDGLLLLALRVWVIMKKKKNNFSGEK